MKYKSFINTMTVSIVASVLLIGCSGSSGSDTDTTSKTIVADGKQIVGSIIKGPIDNATIEIKDTDGNLIASTISENGKFIIPQITLNADAYIIQSTGGSYQDEATDVLVTMSSSQGLKTYLTKEKLQMILDNKEFIAITPETTIYTNLVQGGMSSDDAISIITSSMITTTSPLVIGEESDKYLAIGDFTSEFPKDQSESFARNRAISFSYMIRDANLDANKVFDIIDLISTDLADGTSDGIDTDNDGSIDLNVTSAFGLSRSKLFQNTITNLREGNLSDGQIEELSQMGINTDQFNGSLEADNTTLDKEITKFLASSTLPTLHRLTVINDEDGNTTDSKETYTLIANTNVDVEIETPEGSWTTPMWRYNDNALPIIIKTSRGTEMTLNFDNQLDSNSTIHWHGFKIPAHMDGGPDVPVESNTTKAYTFTMLQPAAPLWFHPHPDMQTGKQVYMGLAGVFLLEDDISKSLEINKEIPSGSKDTVLLVQDRRFDGNTTDSVRNLQYMNLDMDMDGMLGDTILVNGSVMPKQDVSNTKHRYRLYNVSNARTYDFALSDGSDFTVIATDGGFLQKPVSVSNITLGAGQRVEIVIDFAKYDVGEKVLLVSRPMVGDMMAMGDMNMSSMGGMSDTSRMGGMSDTSSMDEMDGRTPNGAGLTIMRFDITSDENEDITLYTDIDANAEITTRLTENDADNKGNERVFLMSMNMNMNGGISFVINGKEFDSTRVDEFIASGATEIWSIKNMSPMAHPFHAHAIQYQILTRDGVAASGVDLGWKDTFLVQPGETVRIIGKFDGVINYGDYMYHCHILEHEDAGMMGYFRIGDTGNLGEQN